MAVATPGSWLLAPALGAGLRRREQQRVLREHGRLEKYGSPSSKIDAISETPVSVGATQSCHERQMRRNSEETDSIQKICICSRSTGRVRLYTKLGFAIIDRVQTPRAQSQAYFGHLV